MSGLLARLNLRFDRSEISGSLGDLGLFLPLAAGLSVMCGMDFGQVLFFAGAMNLVSGTIFGIPISVQPMKVIAAVAIAEGLRSETIMAAGILAGAIILILALSGLIDRANRIIPKAVVRGLQMAIGIKLVLVGIKMIRDSGLSPAPDSVFTAMALFVFVLISFKYERIPGALLLFVFGVILVFFGNPGIYRSLGLGWQVPGFNIPSMPAFIDGFWLGTLPQLPLTILNSVVAVCALSFDLFPERALMPGKVAVSVGLMNLVACPFGGMPMCHGSGGLAAQYRFGARTGGSVVFLGLAKMILAVTFGNSLLAIVSVYPVSVLGVMLLFAGWQLVSACLDMRRRTEILSMVFTAGACLIFGMAWGFAAGFIAGMISKRTEGFALNTRRHETPGLKQERKV